MEKDEKLLIAKNLPEKVFKVRDSIFTTVFKDKHVKSLHNFLLVSFIGLAIQNALNDYLYDGGSQYGFRIIKLAFAKIHLSILVWPILLLLHFSVYWSWIAWATLGNGSKIWNLVWASTAFLAFFGTFHYVAVFCIAYELGIGSRCIILAEQLRFIMKGYAFLRTNIKELTLCKENFKYPRFSQFLYFSFAPTLLYRNEYPRTKTRNWFTVFKYFWEVLVYLYLMSLIEHEYFIKPLQYFGREPFGALDVLYIYFKHALPAFVVCIIFAQFCILHSFQNAFAEMLMFGDREFFTDWWTVTNIGQFHQKWNVLVQDWLYTYVYKEIYENIAPRKKTMAKAAVFILSTILHEVLFMYATQLTLPIFIFGMTVSFLHVCRPTNANIYNVIQLAYLLTGKSLLFTLPHLEYFAKINCPNQPDTLIYVPRLFSCNQN